MNPTFPRLHSIFAMAASFACLLAVWPALPQPAPRFPERNSLPAQLPSAALLAELRRGGYVLFFRHPATDFTENDALMQDFDQCAAQRNLSDKGRQDSRIVGVAMRALGIPIGKVLASPLCRTVETAQLAFGRAEKMNEAAYATALNDHSDYYAEIRKLFATKPAAGANTVIVSHGAPFYAVTGGLRLAEGEMAVIRPLDARFEIVARIRMEDWAALRAAAGNN